MEIMNTIEAKFGENELLDMTFATKRLSAYKIMFPDLDCIGFYSAVSNQ